MLISSSQARPNHYSTNANHLNSRPNDLGKSSSSQSNETLNALSPNHDESKPKNRSDSNHPNQNEPKRADWDNYSNNYQLSNQPDNQLDNSKLNNETKSECSGSSPECSTASQATTKKLQNQPTNSISNFKPENEAEDKKPIGIRDEQSNATTLNRMQLELPHSRPEGEQPEDEALNSDQIKSNSRTNDSRTDGKSKSAQESAKVRNQSDNDLIVPFTPVTITWTKLARDKPNSKCTPKAVPNSTYKLKYNGFSVQYRCNDDYAARGPMRLYCFQGAWVPSKPPICERKLQMEQLNYHFLLAYYSRSRAYLIER